MRSDIYEILIKLGFDEELGRSFRMTRGDIALSLSTSKAEYSPIMVNTSIFLIEKIKSYESDILLTESDVLIIEVFTSGVDYDKIRELILRFFQSDIRERSLNYLLNN